MRGGRWIGVVVGVGLCALVSAAPAEEPLPRFGKWRQHLGLQTGYGFGVGQYGSENTPNADVRLVPIFAGWRIGLSDPLFTRMFMKGNFEFEVEPQFVFNTEPRFGYGGGVALNFGYNMLRWDPVVPFFKVGAGVMGLDFDLSQAEPLNFVVQGGAGAHYRLTDRFAISLAYRFHHVSNAHIEQPNDGFTSHMVLIGPTFFLK